MMHISLRGAVAGLCLLVAAAACDEPEYDVLSPDATTRENFTATLTGAAERPNPVTTTATGSFGAQIRDLTATGGTVRIELQVSGIDSVTDAHIHAGDANTAGPVIVALFGPSAGTPRATTGVLSQRDITRSSTFGTGFTFDNLITRLRNGTAYVNVHTKRFPGGEVRGQIAASTTGFPF